MVTKKSSQTGSDIHDEFRHLCNQEYNVNLAMNRAKAIEIYKRLVDGGYDNDKAIEVVKYAYGIDLSREDFSTK